MGLAGCSQDVTAAASSAAPAGPATNVPAATILRAPSQAESPPATATTVPETAVSTAAVPATPAPVTPATTTPPLTLGHRSATLDQLALPDVVAPVRLRVPDLGLDAEVAAVSADPDGDIAVPPSPDVVAWYEYGPAPGAEGSAVLAAHVDWNGAKGLFFSLGDLSSGAPLTVVLADGREVAFQVVAVERVAKSELPRDRLFDPSGPPRLALVTCGGAFDRSQRRYQDNVIAWAEAS